jgi:ribosome-associated heat shock protein Hsp15
VDKYLWAIRVFKTRSLATEACKTGKVKWNGQNIKASHEVKKDQIFTIQRGPDKKIVRVKELLFNRVDATKALDYYEDQSPKPEEIPFSSSFLFGGQRDRGTGRPTKKQRRDLDDFKTES